VPSGSPFNKTWPGKWYLNPSNHLVARDMCRKLSGAVPIWKGASGSQCKCNAAEAHLRAKLHSISSNRLACELKTQPDRMGQTGRQTSNGVIIEGKPSYKRSPKQYDKKR